MKKKIFITLLLIAVLLVVAYSLFRISGSRDFQFYGGLVTKAETTDKVVALTFDDGPTDNTDEILSILKEEDVKATFFVTGREVKENFEEAQKLAKSGHELGNHSYSHKRMVLKTPTFIKNEIEKTDELIRKAGYKGPIPFRPPYGKKLIGLPRYLDKHDRKTILWNLEPDSYPEIASDSEKIVKHVNEKIEPGSIILLHVMYGSREESLESVKGIIKDLKAKGYSFQTVSEMLK
ncbi:polysaccharide deacetylase family protein [Fictibacillus phosphorivorans]|uniref:polysaccharide deacetylase family protein n=1 Tax=Fictibacillus phosphorivorans TaxID=1221500 RepID=UPI00204090E3|nr:polysaccharide deacetylase family protein [Fictibacillus phosphorivorans]MCM3718979.1 polysaccharide deacetylase family protein [Fictibacillus phosphorivorans]MCM3776601.1 polysaccharide deacetylase family protein [Fictibacillus phosphorivorans]